MTKRRTLPLLAIGIGLASSVASGAREPGPAAGGTAPQHGAPTTQQANDLGPENGAMASAVGRWDVTETVWDRPGAVPVVTSGLVADRRMVGSILEETLHAPSDPARPLRVDYLSFNRVEGRWDYVSMDTRAAVGIMTAQSFDRGAPGTIAITFQPFALPGPGPAITGPMLRMREDIVTQGTGRDVKNQYFLMADGSGTEWLAHRYAYRRRDAAETSPPPPGASARVDAIRQRGVLRVAVLDEYPWLKQTPGAAEPFAGPAWLLAKSYARRLGVTLATVPVGFADKVTVLADGRADITVAPLLVTPERARAVDLIVYSTSGQCLFGLASNPKVAGAQRIEGLNRPDVTLAYTIGTPQADWAMRKLPRTKRLGVPGTIADVRLSEVQSQRADVGSIDKFFFAGLAKRTSGLVSVPKGDACIASSELPIPIAMAVAKGQPAFADWLRAVAASDAPQLAAEEARVERAGD